MLAIGYAIMLAVLSAIFGKCTVVKDGYCPVDKSSSCSDSAFLNPRYLFYDVNPSEGFNLRRDVFMRLAVFMHKFAKKHNEWKLVLPPWNHLYHWKSDFKQDHLPWRHFFDVDSMKEFAPVIDLDEVPEEPSEVDLVYSLQHFENAFTTKKWDWSDRFEIKPCNGTFSKYREVGSGYLASLWGSLFQSKDVKCVSFQGRASLLEELLDDDAHIRIVIDRAEVALHDSFGDKLYWECRRSMRFAQRLVSEANAFRQSYLNSTDDLDGTRIPARWQDQKGIVRKVKGGLYICAHLRRGDFLYGRKNEVPTLESAADQLITVLVEQNLKTVFLCTDGDEADKLKLKLLLTGYTVVTYEPTSAELNSFKDGGVAIIDQIICSQARYFIGSHESTFSFRIQEEREIRGFPVEHTFNRFCGLNEKCEQPSKWEIVF
ncbi:O-fucosyltransferase 2 [Nesidiocoris tenuis]|uniref:GDP-fucose protein O-fucosyltransferase 2 n=1 Tax=Nesidiocoris tenuis TaxID=355587 RepID=A0ABN7B0I9_9HEMI|nr:O-fucosyltransferase 2 [Nesidiocoris tenuis]